MSDTPLSFNHPPALSDQTAAQLLDMLYEMAAAVENHYAAQIRRYYAAQTPDFDDDLPEF